MLVSPSFENRNDRRRAKTRQLLLEAADRLYRKEGVEATTIKDIATEADVAHGSFYNHFKSVDEIASTLAEATFRRAAATVAEILSSAPRVEMLPCIGARVIIRTLLQDPATRWMIGRPQIFVAELLKVSVPFMRDAEQAAVVRGYLKPAGGHEAWLRSYPWLLLGQLSRVIDGENGDDTEDTFARISLRLLGIDDVLADDLMVDSRELVDVRLPLS